MGIVQQCILWMPSQPSRCSGSESHSVTGQEVLCQVQRGSMDSPASHLWGAGLVNIFSFLKSILGCLLAQPVSSYHRSYIFISAFSYSFASFTSSVSSPVLPISQALMVFLSQNIVYFFLNHHFSFHRCVKCLIRAEKPQQNGVCHQCFCLCPCPQGVTAGAKGVRVEQTGTCASLILCHT